MPSGFYKRDPKKEKIRIANVIKAMKKRIYTPELREKIRKSNLRGEMRSCSECKKEVYRHKYRLNAKECFCNRKCESYWKLKNMNGYNSPAWEGGISPLRERIRGLKEYSQWRDTLLHIYNHTCQECFVKNLPVHTHHKKQFKFILRDFIKEYNQFSPIEDRDTLVRLAINYAPFWDLNNGTVLCIDCHSKQPGHENLKSKVSGFDVL